MGEVAALLCTLFSASKDLVSKSLASRLHGNASTFASFAFALPFYLLILGVIWLFGHDPIIYSLVFWQFVVMRAITDTFAEGLKMHALAHGDISLVSSFMSFSPVFLLFLEPFITGDHSSPTGILGVLLVVIGSLLLLYRPPPSGWAAHKRGVVLAFAASGFFTANTLLDTLATRAGAKTTTEFGAAVFSSFAVTLISALCVLPLVLGRVHWRAMYEQQTGLWPRGLFEMLFMVSKLLALQSLAPSYVSSIMRLSLLISIVGGRVYFKEEDFRRRLMAGFLIVIGILVITLMKDVSIVSPP